MYDIKLLPPKSIAMCHVTSFNFGKQVITVQDRDIVAMVH